MDRWPRYFNDSTGIGWIHELVDGSTEVVYFVRDEEDGVLDRDRRAVDAHEIEITVRLTPLRGFARQHRVAGHPLT